MIGSYAGPRVASPEYNKDEQDLVFGELNRIAKESQRHVPALVAGPILRRVGESLKFEILNRVQPAADGLVVTLPSATAADGGRVLEVAVSSSAGLVTYVGKGALVNGESGWVAPPEYGLRSFRWDGTEWFTRPDLFPIGWTLNNLDGQNFTFAGGDETATWNLVDQEGGCFDAGAPTLITVPPRGGGRYQLAAHVGFATVTGTNFALKIKLGGVSIARESARGGGVAGLGTTLCAATSARLVPGDVLIVTVDMDSVNETSSTAAPGMRFTGARIGP